MAQEICGLTIEKEIGDGSCGKVYKLKGVNKTLKVTTTLQPLELVILTQFRHENLMSAERVVGNDSSIGWVMPYGVADLNKFILEERPSPPQRVIICHRLVGVVKFLLDNKILHLDLKPENVIMECLEDKSYRPLLGDFDMSATVDDPMVPIVISRQIITINMRPPENLPLLTNHPSRWKPTINQQTYGEATLVWCLGVIFQFVFGRVYPDPSIINEYKNHRYKEEFSMAAYLRKWYCDDTQRKHTIETFIVDAGSIKDDVVNLINKMLHYDKAKRPTLEQILNDKLFAGLALPTEGKLVPIPAPPITSKGGMAVERLLHHIRLYPTQSSAFVFDAIDLIYRGIHLIPLDTPLRQRMYHLVCLLIARKLHAWKVPWLMSTDFTAEETAIVDTMEREFIIACQGQLRRSYIYDACSAATFPAALKLITNPTNYLTVNLDTLHGGGSQVKPGIDVVLRDRPYDV